MLQEEPKEKDFPLMNRNSNYFKKWKEKGPITVEKILSESSEDILEFSNNEMKKCGQTIWN